MATDVEASTELVVPEHAATLFVASSPAELIAAATDAADRLAEVITKQRLYTSIKQRKHVRVEGWQTCGTLVGVFAVKDSGTVELAWPTLGDLPEVPPTGKQGREDYAHLRELHRARDLGKAFGFRTAYRAVKDGAEVGWGEGRCTRSETTWVGRDDYALASQSQTRGQSRALKQPLGFIVSLAGFSTTPAEEMPDSQAATLSSEGLSEVAADLQQAWPSYDAHDFLRVLARRVDITEPVGVALRAWAWWAKSDVATGNERGPVAQGDSVEPPAAADGPPEATEVTGDGD